MKYKKICNSLDIAIEQLIEAKSELCGGEFSDENSADNEIGVGEVRVYLSEKIITIDIDTGNEPEKSKMEESLILHLSGRPQGLKPKKICPKCKGLGKIYKDKS